MKSYLSYLNKLKLIDLLNFSKKQKNFHALPFINSIKLNFITQR